MSIDGLESRGICRPGFRWGKPSEYAWLATVSGKRYEARLLAWLEDNKPELAALTRKELARDRKRNPDTAAQAGKAGKPDRAGGKVVEGGGVGAVRDGSAVMDGAQDDSQAWGEGVLPEIPG